jgi:hypothetical protein
MANAGYARPGSPGEEKIVVALEGRGAFDRVRWLEELARAAGGLVSSSSVDPLDGGEAGDAAWRVTVRFAAASPWTYNIALGRVVDALCAYGRPRAGATAVPQRAGASRAEGASFDADDRAETPAGSAKSRAQALLRQVAPWATLITDAAAGPAPLRAAEVPSPGALAVSSFALSDSARLALTQGGAGGAGTWPTTICRDFLQALHGWNVVHGGALPVALDFAVGTAPLVSSATPPTPFLRRLYARTQDLEDRARLSALASSAMLGAQPAGARPGASSTSMSRLQRVLAARAQPTAILAAVATDPFRDRPVGRDAESRVVLDGFTVTQVSLAVPPPAGTPVAAAAVLYASGICCTVCARTDVLGDGGAARLGELWSKRLEVSSGAPADRAEELKRLLAVHAEHKGRTQPLRSLPIGKGVRPEPLGMPPQLTP